MAGHAVVGVMVRRRKLCIVLMEFTRSWWMPSHALDLFLRFAMD
jgi:hypothetical protein